MITENVRSMSEQDNLTLVRAMYDAWQAGDWSATDWADPDIEYVMVDEPGEQVHHGIAAMSATWRQFLSAWEGYRIEADEYRVLDSERVLVLLRVYGLGKASGLDLNEVAPSRRGANVLQVRDGKVIRLTAYFDHERALADLAAEGGAVEP